MWAADDELKAEKEPAHREAPNLFHEMEHFYGDIAGKLEQIDDEGTDAPLDAPGPMQSNSSIDGIQLENIDTLLSALETLGRRELI